jgi:membrane associated rhomboid family serine protease
MGIYDREYYRDETGGLGWFAGNAPAVRTIILINVVVFLVQIFSPRLQLDSYLGANPVDIFHKFKVWQLLTATFLHEPRDFLHIIFNLLFLWFVGREMEAMYGSREFTFFYLAAAVVSTLGWAGFEYATSDRNAIMVGASGAVTAVAVLYTLYYPNREILFFFIPVRMWVLLAVFLGFDFLRFVQQAQGGPIGRGSGVAFASHLTGAAFAWLYKSSGMRLSRLSLGRLRRPRLRVVVPERRAPSTPRAGSAGRPEPVRVGRPSAVSTVSQEQLDARLDEVLAKIAREGRGALSDEDKSILEEASRRARIKRNDH